MSIPNGATLGNVHPIMAHALGSLGWISKPMTYHIDPQPPVQQPVNQDAAAERHAHLREARQDAYAKRVAHDDVRALLTRLQIELPWDLTERLTKEAVNGYNNGRLVAEYRDMGQE